MVLQKLGETFRESFKRTTVLKTKANESLWRTLSGYYVIAISR